MVQKTTLANGLRIITERIDYVESAALGIDVMVGSRDENDHNRGISHFIEHMQFKGTPKYNQLAMSQAWDFIGGSPNAYTSKERTMYYGSVLAEFYLDALELLTDQFLNATIPAEELETERGVILREIEMREDDPENLAYELFQAQFWPTHNLGKEIIGKAETVSTFTRDDLVQYKTEKYTPDVVVVSVAGKVDHDAVVAHVETQMGHLTGNCKDWRTPNTPAIPATFTAKVKRPVQTSHVHVGYPSFDRFNPKRWSATILSSILGGGMSSRLFQEIREKRGLAYSVMADAMPYSEGAMFVAYAGTEVKSAKQVISLMKDEFKRISDAPVDEGELIRTQRSINSGIVMSQERMSSRMQQNSSCELYFGRHIGPIERIDKINAVTVDDVQAVAQELFDLQKEAIFTLGKR